HVRTREDARPGEVLQEVAEEAQGPAGVGGVGGVAAVEEVERVQRVGGQREGLAARAVQGGGQGEAGQDGVAPAAVGHVDLDLDERLEQVRVLAFDGRL